MLTRLMSYLVVVVLTLFTMVSPALAADLSNGSKVFGSNCASCHMGGANVINRAKTLSQGDLSKYGMNSLEAIVKQVTNGKPPMPAFKSRLTVEEIEDVSSYVLDQAQKGW